jgi:Phosphoesterase family
LRTAINRRLIVAALGAAVLMPACQNGSVGPRAGAQQPVSIPFRGAQPATVVESVDGIRRSVAFKTKIQHVVVISMENRTVDNLFAALYSNPFPGGGTWGSALNLRNPKVSPTLQPNGFNAHFDPNHLHDVGWKYESQGLWDKEPFACATKPCPSYATPLSYVPATDDGSKIYQSLVENWSIAVNMLQANEGPSFPAHQYFISGQSGGVTGSASAPDAESENPVATAQPTGDYVEDGEGVDIATGGCDTPGFSIATVDMSKPVPARSPFDNGKPLRPPCDEYQTILDEIVSAQGPPDVADWQYIAHSKTTIWAAPLGVEHLYKQYANTDAKNEPFAVDQDAVNFVRNVTGSTNPAPNPERPFASLTYITPCEHEADHPHVAGIDNGPRWLGWVINSIGESKYWKSTAIIITWDDWGGWYDHVPGMPNPGPFRPKINPYDNPDDPNEWGFRIPLLVISPYVHKAFVSTQATSGFKYRSQSVIMQFVEANFGLPSLGADDTQGGQRDALKDMFDFAQKPRPYVPVDVTFKPPALGQCL